DLTYPGANPPYLPPDGSVISNMRDVLYQGTASCPARPQSSPICVPYNQVVQFFMANYNKGGANCSGPLEANDFLAHLYGWAAFDSKCPGGNALANTPGFAAAMQTYIDKLEYPFDANNLPLGNQYAFNPYTRLIHSDTYLGMKAAYAFSIDDRV